jgi:hypothetical protein
MAKAKNPHWGSTVDDFLKAEGIHEQATTAAIKSVIALQFARDMKKKLITKKKLSEPRGAACNPPPSK